jgi:hypothetical protein
VTTSAAAWRPWLRGQFIVSCEPQGASGAAMAVGKTGGVATF